MKLIRAVCTLAVVTLMTPLASRTQAPQPQRMTNEELTRYVQERSAQANELWGVKKYEEAIPILEELNALPRLAEIGVAQSDVLYNLACGYSLLGQKDKALSYLHEAVKEGYSDLLHLERDDDLENIRRDPRYDDVVVGLKRAGMLWDNPVFSTPYRADISQEEKVAGLGLFWSEVKFNFVFTNRLIEINWDSLYVAYLPLVQETKSTAEYYLVLSRLCALLRDGHTNVNLPGAVWAGQLAVPGISTWAVNDTVLVLGADDSLRARGIGRGLQIVGVGRLPVREYAERNVAPFISASTRQDLLTRMYGRLLLAGPEGTSVEVTFRDSTGATFTRTLVRPVLVKTPPSGTANDSSAKRETPPPLEFKLLPGNIAYVSLDSFNDQRIVAQFDSIFPAIQKTDALILDVRANGGGNSGYGWQILGYLTDKPFATSQWRTRDYRPAYRAWGRGERWFSQKGEDGQPNGKALYTKPVAVLAGPRTFSAAEDFCVAFDCMHRGTIIGTKTGGSTGQPLMFKLPGGGNARVCTKHDRYPDGREFVGVGVNPGIEVHRSVADVLGGRDRALDAAVKHLNGMIR